jgi:hypothetical protein
MVDPRNRYSHINLNLNLVLAFAVVLLGVATLSPQVSPAAQASKGAPPVVDGETQLFPGYPRQFDGAGHIDRMGDQEIVISDELLRLPSGADLHTPNSRNASKSRFAEGDYVGYRLDESGAIESLWLLKKGKR